MDLSELAIELFCQFDPDQKGYITQEQMLSRNGKESPFSDVQLHSIFALLDKDKKGVITLSDFTDAFLDVSDVAITEKRESTYNDNNREYVEDDEIEDDGDEYIDDKQTRFDDNNYYEFVRDVDDEESLYCTDEVIGYRDEDDHVESDAEETAESREVDMFNYLNKVDRCNDVNFTNLRKYNSTEYLLNTNMYRTSSTKDFQQNGVDDLDDYWWEHGKRIDGLCQSITTRRKNSLPSLNDEVLRTGLTNVKKWKSFEFGMNKLFSKKNSSENLIALSLHNKNNLFRSYSQKDLKQNLLKFTPVHQCKTHKQANAKKIYNSQKSQNGSKSHISQEFDEIFGSLKNVIPSRECLNSCESCSSDDALHVQKIIKPNLKRFLSYSSTSLARERREKKAQKLFRTKSSLEITDQKEMLSKKSCVSEEALLSSSTSDFKCGLQRSSENLTSTHDYFPEQWESYLRRIGGVSMFAGNHNLRYVWQQIGSFQNNLLLPLEDFLKGIIEEQKTVYTRCQEVESTLHSKIEQHEHDIENLYEEFDRTCQQELQDLEKKHCEREETLKCEFNRIVDIKEQALQDAIGCNNEVNERLELSEHEISTLQLSKHKVEQQYRQVCLEHQKQITELEKMVGENALLKERNGTYEESLRDMQECINQLLRSAEEEREKQQCFMRQFKDVMEEKEFLEANISNLSMENIELRNLNKSLTVKDDDMCSSLNFTSNDNISQEGTPNGASTPNAQIQSLHEEMSKSNAEIEENEEELESLQKFQDPLSPITKKNISNEFYEHSSEEEEVCEIITNDHAFSFHNCGSDDDNLNDETLIESMGSLDEYQNNFETTRNRIPSLRLVSSVQTEFKVIFCGDCEVGKTSLIHRLCFNKFSKSRRETTRIDCYTKIVETGDSQIKLKLWDTVGQERFNSLPRSYYRKCDVVVLLYDICKESSFINAKSWLKTIHDCTNENAFLLLLGNKIDMNHKRSVLKEDGEHLAEENDAIFQEVSAKSGENVDTLIEVISSLLKDREETLIIRNDYEHSLCNIDYNRKRNTQTCC